MKDAVYFSPNRQTSSWIIDDQTCWLQTSNPKIAEQIHFWSFASQVGEGFNCSLWIYSIPRSKWRWVLRTLGIRSPAQDLQRRIAGLKMGRKNLKKGPRAQVKKI